MFLYNNQYLYHYQFVYCIKAYRIHVRIQYLDYCFNILLVNETTFEIGLRVMAYIYAQVMILCVLFGYNSKTGCFLIRCGNILRFIAHK